MRFTDCVATSLAGRDKGRTFVIVGVLDEEHVYIADGRMRKIEKPKKKKLKHLKVELVSDADLLKALRSDKLTNRTAAKITASYHKS